MNLQNLWGRSSTIFVCCHTLHPLFHPHILHYTHTHTYTQALEKALKDKKLDATTSNSSKDDGGEGPSAELADAIAQRVVAALLLQAQQIDASGYKFTGMRVCKHSPFWQRDDGAEA